MVAAEKNGTAAKNVKELLADAQSRLSIDKRKNRRVVLQVKIRLRREEIDQWSRVGIRLLLGKYASRGSDQLAVERRCSVQQAFIDSRLWRLVTQEMLYFPCLSFQTAIKKS